MQIVLVEDLFEWYQEVCSPLIWPALVLTQTPFVVRVVRTVSTNLFSSKFKPLFCENRSLQLLRFRRSGRERETPIVEEFNFQPFIKLGFVTF